MQVACMQIAHFMCTLFFARITVHISLGELYIYFPHKNYILPQVQSGTIKLTNIHFTSSLISIAMKLLDK